MIHVLLSLLFHIQASTVGPFPVGTPTNGAYVETCEATIFCHVNDALCGGKSAFLGRHVLPTDVGVAHRTLPFGTKLKITNVRTEKTVAAWVIDRGPFGRLSPSGIWYNGADYYRKFHRQGQPIPVGLWVDGVDGWRGCLDMTPAAAYAIGLNGKEAVVFEVVKWPATVPLSKKPAT